VVSDYTESDAFDLDQENWKENYRYLDPVKVSDEFNYISGIAGVMPSPDWFTGFYLFNTVKNQGLTFWDSFKLRTYPWDAGTDDGQRFTDPDQDTDPPENVVRFTTANSPNKAFVSQGGDEVLYLAEWECVLHTCPLDNPDCEMENWPPANGCDVLRYPECAEECNPDVDNPCDKCENGANHKDCCLAGSKPEGGNCGTASGAVEVVGSATVLLSSSVLLGLFFF
jgi:hypothetical protein